MELLISVLATINFNNKIFQYRDESGRDKWVNLKMGKTSCYI